MRNAIKNQNKEVGPKCMKGAGKQKGVLVLVFAYLWELTVYTIFDRIILSIDV